MYSFQTTFWAFSNNSSHNFSFLLCRLWLISHVARDCALVDLVQIELNDEEILSVLRTQGQRASKSHQELITAKVSVRELHDTMGQILEEANQTQTKVDVICKDIRAMDHAKRNLTQSISILENFGTLTDALNDLKETSNDRCGLKAAFSCVLLAAVIPKTQD
jgi:Vps53-like, N-terminal